MTPNISERETLIVFLFSSCIDFLFSTQTVSVVVVCCIILFAVRIIDAPTYIRNFMYYLQNELPFCI